MIRCFASILSFIQSKVGIEKSSKAKLMVKWKQQGPQNSYIYSFEQLIKLSQYNVMEKKRKSLKLKSKIKKVSNCDIKLQPIRKSAKYNHAKDRSANISVISNLEQSVLNDGAPSRKSSLVTKNC